MEILGQTEGTIEAVAREPPAQTASVSEPV